jgi:hypothetical protein
LEEISWEESFEKFDREKLALVYQESTARGQKSNFNKIFSRETVTGGAPSRSGARKSRGRARSESGRKRSGTVARKAPRKTAGAGKGRARKRSSAGKTSARKSTGRNGLGGFSNKRRIVTH